MQQNLHFPIKRNSSALFAIAALLWACGPSAEPLTPPPPVAPPSSSAAVTPKAELPPSISPDPQAIERLRADVAYLASPELKGRGTGDEGAKLAADFIAKRFTELGLLPFGDKDEKGQATYFQRFSARVGAKVDPPSLSFESGKPAKKTVMEANAMVTADGSASGTISGEAVFVGYGIVAPALNWDDYAGANLEGKIAVILSGAPKVEGKDKKPDVLRDFGSIRYKLRTAREHKAVGVIVIAAGDELPAAPNDSTSMGLPALIAKRSNADKFLSGAKLADKKTWEVTASSKARPLGKNIISITTTINPIVKDAWNVVAMLPARSTSKTASEWVVMGAHYDHLGMGETSASRAPGSNTPHLGADDNASGTALLLESARRFSKLETKPARNIAFIAFGAEEIGAIGSHHWVQNPPIAINSVVAMVNADMVGRLRDDKLVVDGTKTAANWEEVAKAANLGLNLNLVFGAEGFGASDHASFTAARVPVSFLFTGVHDDYHKPSDTADKINFAGQERVTTLASRIALAAAERPDRMVFMDAPADPNKSSRGGFKVSMGTVPDYAFEGKGMKLSGVRPDAPAQRAGMQAGDIIVKVGSHEITNVHDFMFSLKELEPGKEIVVEVLRDGKAVPLKVIPAPGTR